MPTHQFSLTDTRVKVDEISMPDCTAGLMRMCPSAASGLCISLRITTGTGAVDPTKSPLGSELE